MENKILRYVAAFALLFGTLGIQYAPPANAFAAAGYNSLVIGCVGGPQNGLVVPQTSSTFAGCTITVYNHNTSTLAGLYYNTTGSVLTNPIVETLGTGTVTTSGTTVTYVSGVNFVTTGAWVGQTINIAGVAYTISSVTNSTTLVTTQTLATIAVATSYIVSPQAETFYAADGMYDVCVSNALSTPVLQGSCNYGLTIYAGNFTANKALLTAAFTDANASGLQAITGLSFVIPSTFVGNLSFHCAIGYSEATPAAGVGFGVGWLTTAPTRLDAVHTTTYSSAVPTLQITTTPITNLTTTTPTAFGTVTPASTTVYPAYIDGVAQAAGGGAATLQFYVQQGTSADLVVIAPGSYCNAW